MIPFVWMIMIAASSVGDVEITHIPFETVEACEDAVKFQRESKPSWNSYILVYCARTGVAK